ncbi:MAG: sigma-70 family RNA polymerase sigma factor [Planctomycetes bacterium]|nr:sigma-70 family RNA polymerase sigma factor [Planctomycetota bacterium]
MPDPAEVDLIQRCQKGHEGAFRELMERYQRRTYWIAHNMLNNYDLAQDISQEAFIRVFRNLRNFDVKKNFYTWLYQIVVNLCIDHLRKMSHGRTVDLDEVGGLPDDEKRNPHEESGRAELRGRVQKTLDRLPPKYKAVIMLRDIQGFSCEEISEIVGCTNATTRWRLHRARKLFKALWTGKRVEAARDDDGDADLLQ